MKYGICLGDGNILVARDQGPDGLQGEGVTQASGLTWHSQISFFLLRRVYTPATQVGGIPFLRARITLGGGLTFSLANTPGRVNLPTPVDFLIVFRHGM